MLLVSMDSMSFSQGGSYRQLHQAGFHLHEGMRIPRDRYEVAGAGAQSLRRRGWETECQASVHKPGALEQPEDPSFRPTEFLTLACIPSVCTPKKPQNVK